MSKIKELFIKYKEIILYFIFGVITTLVNLGIFWVFNLILGDRLYLVSNIIAWILAAIFAYFVNKVFVFESKSWDIAIVKKEFIEFLGARLFSFLVEEGGMFLFIDIIGFDEFELNIRSFTVTGTMITKCIFAVIVVILNYFFSKFMIFTKKDKKE